MARRFPPTRDLNCLVGFHSRNRCCCDAAREKLEAALKELVDPKFTHAQMRTVDPERLMATPAKRSAAHGLMERLAERRARCQRQTNSVFTPMGDEMFYRYQQSLIDEATTTVDALLQRLPDPAYPKNRE
jgi:hypothetical protein